MYHLFVRASAAHAARFRNAGIDSGRGDRLRRGASLSPHALSVPERIPAQEARVLSRARTFCRTVALLVCVVASSDVTHAAESLRSLLDRASSLAQQKNFAAAEAVSREAVSRFPRSVEAERTLAYILLWQAKYDQSRALFARIIARNSRDAEARTGLAQTYYWSGDYRGALREFERRLRLQPSNAEAQRVVEEIRAAARPGYAVDGSAIDDDQPYRSAGSVARMFLFSDPLTKWEVTAGTSRLRALGLTRETTQIGLAGETTLPSLRTRIRGSVQRFTFPDGSAQLLPFVGAERRLATTNLTFSAERRALLRSAPALRTHPSGDALTLRWSRENGDRLQFAVRGEHIRYFDRNRGWGTDGYVLVPIARRSAGNLSLGGSVAYRDTEESRFRLANASTLEGIYDPYYTPQRLAEARLVVAATIPRRRVTTSIHLDGGVARERVIAFASAAESVEVDRSFDPWRASVSAAVRITPTVTLSLSAAHESTAFYNVNEIRAGVAGRF